MALISTEVAVAQPAPGTADSSGRLVQTWDKTFPRSEKVDHQKLLLKTVTALRWPQMCIFKIAGTRSLLRLLFPGLWRGKRAGLGSLCSDFSRARIRDAGI